jgi:hypothetical protein
MQRTQFTILVETKGALQRLLVLVEDRLYFQFNNLKSKVQKLCT